MNADIVTFVTEGLGHSSHLVDLGDGTALVIDPARLPTAQRDHAARAGLRIAYTADTHTHADHVSGSPELAADGATFLAPAAARLAFPYQGARDGDVITVGECRLEAIATPGHTPDHLAYLLSDESGPVVLFSGGSLMVGTAGRTDLVVDAREVVDFAAGHIPGSLSIELRPVFASWLGWLTEPEQPVVVVLGDDQDETDLVRQALTIGHDNLAGRLDGGIDAWTAASLPVETTELIEPDTIDRPLLDIRQDSEFNAGHVPGAIHVELGALATAGA